MTFGKMIANDVLKHVGHFIGANLFVSGIITSVYAQQEFVRFLDKKVISK